jgi:hypothetical protein
MNTTIKRVAEVAKALNQTNENSDKKGRHSTYKSKIRRVLKERMVKQIIYIYQCVRSKDRQLIDVPVAVEWRSERRN